MTAITPASSRWPYVFPRSACLLVLLSVSTACGPAESPKASVSEPSPAANPSTPAGPAATNPTEVESTTTSPARAEASSPSTAPAPNRATEHPQVITWGSGPDFFGDTPDKDGYYSSRRHFDLASKDKVRRALVLLERDSDEKLHLRFSKVDIDEMPTVEAVLPLVENAPPESEALLRNEDPLLPSLEVTHFEDHGEGTASTIERRVKPPVAGFELHLNGDEINELLELESIDLATGKRLWNVGGIEGPVTRIEFFASDPYLFYLFSNFRGGGVFDLRTGLRCRFQRDLERNSGIFRPWPSFVGEGHEFQFVEGETIWRVDLSTCQISSVGKVAIPSAAPSGVVDLAGADASADGSIVLAAVGRSSSAFRSPGGLASVEIQFIRLTLEGKSFVERRRVSARTHNSVLGTESAVTETCREPLLVASQFRSRTLNPATGGLERESFSSPVTYLLIQNRFGHFFALRAPLNQGVGIRIDRTRCLLNYGNQWFDLRVLDREEESDFLPLEDSNAH